MKKIINFIVLLLVTNFISCTSNDSIGQTITEADLLGLWEVSELYTENGTTGIYFNGQSISGAYSAVGSDFDMTALFEENPNNFYTSGSFTFNGTISFLNEQFTTQQVVDAIPSFISPASWSLQDNTIALSNADETILSSIIYFNNDTLRLKSAINENILDQLDAAQVQQLNSVLNLSIDSLTVNTDVYITLTK
ncbi:hypothetical protein OAB30_04420 [Polaribacter sp.]|jgi:hypothetical protein|nr:hypothetical protein [Polaribacter sp.]MDB0026349.1 hypothetical protein [Polaribacter sp.]MDB0040494.1 hypothetical protein [Polaribacter sp.]MDB4202261.1 hypothetical protein [Polaribacter sp.]MDB9778041.1 hypothetical protein [Polaribacter sp.]